MLFKVLGVHYNTPTQPNFTGPYISNMSMVKYGDILADEDGNPITFGVVVTEYGVQPPDSAFSPGDTKYWYNLSTRSVWSKTKELDGTFVLNDMGFTNNSNVMLKSTYDSNEDGVVNAADALWDGYNLFTGATISAHIANSIIHSRRDDAVVNATYVWSSFKINAELLLRDAAIDTKSPADHVHGPFDGTTPTGSPSQGFVPQPPFQDERLLLKTDGSWAAIKSSWIFLDQLGDTNIAYPEDYEILVRYNNKWQNAGIISSPTINAVVNPAGKTFWFEASSLLTRGPAVTTVGNIPTWKTTGDELSDGLALHTAIASSPSDSALLTEKAVSHELGILDLDISNLTVAVNAAIVALANSTNTALGYKLDKPVISPTPGNLGMWMPYDEIGDSGITVVSSLGSNPTDQQVPTALLVSKLSRTNQIRTLTNTDVTVLVNDGTVLVSAGTASRNVTLPPAVMCRGYIYTVKKVDAGVGLVNVLTAGGSAYETIDGQASKTLTYQWDSVTVQSDGSNWYII